MTYRATDKKITEKDVKYKISNNHIENIKNISMTVLFMANKGLMIDFKNRV